MSEHLMCWTH